MKKMRVCLLWILLLTMLLPLAACGSTPESTATPQPEAADTAPPETAAPETEALEETETPAAESGGIPEMYPITEEELILSYWTDFNSPSGAYLEGYEDFPAMQLAEEITGVTMEFTNFSPPQAHEQFPIIIASGDYPDIFRNFLSFYGSSGAEAHSQDIIIDLTDLIAEYAPDYMAVLESDETNYRDAIDDDGKMWVIWSFSKEYYPIEGLTLRADWLEKLDMEVPDTIEKIEAYLTGAKTEFGATAPFLLVADCAAGGTNPFAHAYNVGGYNALDFYDEFIQIDGTVYSSYIQDGYLDYLTLMHSWYEQGLISSDFSSTPFSVKEPENVERISSGATALWVSQTQNWVDYRTAATDPDYELMGIGNVNADGSGSTYLFSAFKRHSRYCYAISTACEAPEAAVQWMNFWFTDYGSNLANYGVEGEDWTWVDGQQTFTEKITNNTELTDLSVTQVANYYTLYNQVIGLMDETRLFQLMGSIETDAIDTWKETKKGDYVIPLGVSLTTPEHDTVTNVMGDIRTYVSENASKFITGERDLSEWDAYVAEIEMMGIQDAVSAYQSAVDRYYSR